MSEFDLHPMMTQSCSFWQSSENEAQRERVGVVALVLALHAGLGLAWMMVPEQPAQVIKEMSVSIAMEQAPVVEEKPEPPPPKPQPKVEKTEKPLPMPVVRELAEQAPQVVPVSAAPPPPQVAAASPRVSAAPVPDTEPDFKASYLKNPRPAYPMVARKMGWEGRVILNVEVLAEGACGGVNVFRSSGREVLDNAAISTVKSWRFIPARHAGRAVTQWFKVPINFSLEDSEV